MNPVKHVAIIMDGNGRWGIKNKGSRNVGHKKGLNTIEEIIKETIIQKIKYLTLYTFSTENWKRPKKEISFLFTLLENFLVKKIVSDIKRNKDKALIKYEKKYSNYKIKSSKDIKFSKIEILSSSSILLLMN